MDCPACLLEIPTLPCLSGQMPLRAWGCLFVTGTGLEMEPRHCVCWTRALPEPRLSPLLSSRFRQFFACFLSLSHCVATACLELAVYTRLARSSQTPLPLSA